MSASSDGRGKGRRPGRSSSRLLKQASPETLAYVDGLLTVLERALAQKRRSVLAESFGRRIQARLAERGPEG